jgi:serine/threonine-protein kinase
MQKQFAVKLLHPELSMRDDVRQRFLREGVAANSVKHPGAVAVTDNDTAEDGAAFLVMELLEGGEVQQLSEMYGGRMPVERVLAIAYQLLDVLDSAHAKMIVHRDIKPANLFLTTDGTLKVLDFGIARAREAIAGGPAGSQNTGTGILLGTPAFMAPEQALAKTAEIDGQTDVWAAAATFFTLVTGDLVHPGDNPSQLLVFAATEHARPLTNVAPEIPLPIAQAVDRGLAFAKAARWPTAVAMREALDTASRTAFGEAPSRAMLNRVLASRSGATQGIPEPALRTTPEPASLLQAPPAPLFPRAQWHSTTGQPVETLPADSVVPSARRPGSFGRRLAIGFFVVIAVGIVGIAVAAGARILVASRGSQPLPAAMRGESAPPKIETTPPAPLPATATGEVAQPPAFPVSPQGMEDTEAPAAVVVGRKNTRPASWPPAPAHAAPVPARVAAPAHPSTDCNPPFIIDSNGHRVPKPDCL